MKSKLIKRKMKRSDYAVRVGNLIGLHGNRLHHGYLTKHDFEKLLAVLTTLIREKEDIDAATRTVES